MRAVAAGARAVGRVAAVLRRPRRARDRPGDGISSRNDYETTVARPFEAARPTETGVRIMAIHEEREVTGALDGLGAALRRQPSVRDDVLRRITQHAATNGAP